MKRKRCNLSRTTRKLGWSIFLLSLLLPAAPVGAQIMENPVEAPLAFRARVVSGTNDSSTINPSISISLNNQTVSLSNTQLPSYPQNTATKFATLTLDKEYDCDITSVYVGNVEVYFDPPTGLRVLIDGRPQVTHEYAGANTSSQSSETIKIVVTSGRAPLRPGQEIGLKSEHIFWAVSMGRLGDGRSAGMITIREDSFSDDLYTPECLKYAIESHADVDVVRNGGNLRQIKTESVLADIVVTETDVAFEIRFYKKGDYQETLSGGVYPIVSNAKAFIKHAFSNPIVTVSGGVVDDYFNITIDGFVELEFNSNGNAYKTEGSTRTQIATSTDWVRPTSAAGSDYEIKAVKTNGSTPGGSSLNTWLSLASTRGWSLFASYMSDGENDVGCSLTISIRDAATNTVLDSGSYSLTNFYSP